MLIIVGKAEPSAQHVEVYLPQFRQMLQNKGKFVYAWSFNPKDFAILKIQQCIIKKEDIFIYLPFDGCQSNLRMRIIDFRHDSGGIVCPDIWIQYCVPGLRGHQGRVKCIWFLIDAIDDLSNPVDLLNTFVPVFPKYATPRYATWGRNFFAFLRQQNQGIDQAA